MIELKEISIKEIEEFWKPHISYLIDDGIIADSEDIEYFKSDEYNNLSDSESTDRSIFIY